MYSENKTIIEYPITHEQIIEERAKRLTETAHERNKRLVEKSLIEYVKWSFYKKTKKEFIVSPHHIIVCNALERVFRHEINRLIINIPPRYSKCVDENALVFTKRGLVESKKIVAGDYVYSHENGKLVFEKCLGIETAEKESLKFTMRSGRELILSNDHPMLGINGFIEANKFKVGDTVKIIKHGSGCYTTAINKIVKITELGDYGGKPGYKIDNISINTNTRTGKFDGFIGENSFELVNLLEEAKYRYPIGTTFRCIHTKNIYTIQSLSEFELDSYGTCVRVARNTKALIDGDQKWAEIIPSYEAKPMPANAFKIVAKFDIIRKNKAHMFF